MGKITIDHSTPFDPVTFLGKGWSIEEEDERALALTEVDLNNVRFETMLKPGEKCVNGEEHLKRSKKVGHIRLDAKIFQTLWKNQFLIPEKWKEKTNGNRTYIFFDGTVLRFHYGGRCVLSLLWDDGKWRWFHFWLGFDWYASNLFAVLAS